MTFGLVFGAQQDVRLRAHYRHRRAQFVRRVVHELALAGKGVADAFELSVPRVRDLLQFLVAHANGQRREVVRRPLAQSGTELA